MTDPAGALGHQFGQRRPPLSVTIKAILDRYPDGQIFKEIIQNADDAGATTVCFCLDSRQHGTGSLVEPALARFQGPALLAYNNAEFTDDDWEGIQNLQRSVKAEDPFKVGKFGIGFNSVYHITDLPVIVSGQKLAYLEPQEQVWQGESGKYFNVPDLQHFPDTLAPFNNICGFSDSSGNFPATFFRFALRNTPSELSKNLYTVERLHELLEALMEEAKFLLLFLKSVDTIQVIEISQHGRQATVFQVEIEEKSEIQQKRQQFMRQLHSAYSIQSYSISTHIEFTASFHVKITRGYDTTRVHYLVASRVGSDCQVVLRAAVKQHVFPWVGVAVELQGSLVGSSVDPPSIHTGGGRISCFLPMSPEASSPLPPHIHVHGTFGLNDDRRTLKWPGGERRNDPTAEWNILLVKELLPPCYGLLLRHAIAFLTPAQFYEAWPDVDTVRPTPWKALLLPLFRILLNQPVLWTEKTEALQRVGEWIQPGGATFIPKGSKLPSVVHNALSRCNVKLVTIPDKIWKAIAFSGTSVQKISPSLARARFRLNQSSYTGIDNVGKLELLRYCLSDNNYRDLPGLVLLPLADGTFVAFEPPNRYYQVYRYLCSSGCPRHLLPNLDECLVDMSNDANLHSSLLQVANSNFTQLQTLTVITVAQLLPKSMPAEWRGQQVVSLPHYSFPTDWFQKFWEWIQGKPLDTFRGQLVVPCSQSGQTSSVSSFQVTRLNADSSTVYIPARATCSPALMSAFERLQVRCSKVSDFRYLNHWQITSYLNVFTPNGILDAISHSGANPQLVSFTANAASTLREILSQSGSYSPPRLQILQKLSIFATAKNSSNNLYSVIQVKQASCLRRAIMEPQNFIIEGQQLPSNLILFLRQEYNQIRLLQHFGSLVSSPDNTAFLLEFLFPLVQQRSITDHLLDGLMQNVLDNLPYLIPQYHMYSTQSSKRLENSLQNLPFLKTASGARKCPNELFDPADSLLSQLFKGESVFPIHPFNQPQYLTQLRRCGLRTTATPQEIVNIVSIIATAQATSHPQAVSNVRLSRAKAVLAYLGRCDSSVALTSVTLPHLRGWFTFSSALKYLSTNRNWLPVSQSPPTDYPSCLSWKGSPYNSHLVSLNSSVSVLSTDSSSELPFVVGSQMYLVEPSLPSQVVSHCFPSGGIPAKHILAHFQEVIGSHKSISSKQMDQITHLLYQMLLAYEQQGMQSQLKTLHSFHRWIWLRRYQSFVSPSVVAVRQNTAFRQNLEPFLFILPDNLTQYADLFMAFGVTERITQSQIMSVLRMIKDRVSTELRAADAWQMVMSILNWLTNSGETDVELSYDTKLFVPTESESEYPELVEASEVVYTDNDFLKNYLESLESEDSYTFVNHRIHPKMAHCLGLSPLSEHLDISEETFEDYGEHEPLTVRLKNILRDYKDGLTIIKELLQNADDAEATEVNICYDSRTHGIESKSLFFPGMAECHGLALIVQNNAVFTDDDFTSITKLAGATKEEKPLKIGKFGVGFCSVYHVTDIPSFVSRDTWCVFDPTLSYLKREIKNAARPGKKVKFTSKFFASSKQLSPYVDLFDFDPKKPYDGTMFRFPFRTSASELSGTIYTEATVRELINDMKECSSKLLLFLRHVKRITFSQIRTGEQTPTLLLEITKEEESSVSEAKVQKISCKDNRSARIPSLHHEYWLVATHSDYISNNRYATASIACALEVAPPQEITYKAKKVEGEVFCFLPLALKSGLPVHVSGNFAVINNRRGIWTSDDASKNDVEVQWNTTLMQLVVPKVYHSLLIAMQTLHQQGLLENYTFFSMWPLEVQLNVHNPWILFIYHLYIAISSSRLFYSTATSQWLTLGESKFLSPTILCGISSEKTTPRCVITTVEQLNLPIVDLPSHYQSHLYLTSSTVTENEFVKLFFDNIDSLEQQNRNEVLQCMLEVFAMELDQRTERLTYLEKYLRKHACIPCTPDGNVLRKADQVIDPTAEFSCLFDPEEHMFPISQFSEKHLVQTAMYKLGMISDFIPWELLIERANGIPPLYKSDKSKALKRIKLLLKCIDTNLKDNYSKKQDAKSLKQLAETPFLPVLQKPEGYPLPWFGKGHLLLSGKELMVRGIKERYGDYSKKNVDIAGSQVAVINEFKPDDGGCGFLSYKCHQALQVRKFPTHKEVIKHYKLVIEMFSTRDPESRAEILKWTDSVCRQVYEFLDQELPTTDSEACESAAVTALKEELKKLQHLSCVWTGKEFIKPQLIAREWKMEGPYLFQVPSSLVTRRKLATALGIKGKFETKDIIQALQKMKGDFGSDPVSETCRTFLHTLVPELYNIQPSDEHGDIMLPDTSFVLHKASDLAYNDAPWCPPDEGYNYVNGIIARLLVEKLGVKLVRSEKINKYASLFDHFRGVPFGQREELTRRIQNILREYPLDVTLLKELLQNADDAKAKKMYIILDKRTHGKTSVLSENWQELQGPALLVWNDSTFSEKDLKGIQELGLGSKRPDAETIGQYGIGFNVVYHVTDCPSFITGGQTLCIMDPHCRFVPGADETSPGRRFDDLTQGFWDDFPDITSAYLRCGLKSSPKELLSGSLFRFPLRHTQELVRSSQIIDSQNRIGHTEPLTAERMHLLLQTWAPQMKQAMFFLNHVTELKFMVIEERGHSLITEHCFEVQIDEQAQRSRALLHDKISSFKEVKGSEPYIVRYPLTLLSSRPKLSGKKTTAEMWFIQQGIGDVEDNMRAWTYISQVKPRHGLAAPLKIETKPFEGQVFCFLPLPVYSHLPVHVNGHFILDSSRRALWRSTTEGEVDDRTRWNQNLIDAVSSSYANFLINARGHYVRAEPYEGKKRLNDDVSHYYDVFPNWSKPSTEPETKVPEGIWIKLAEDVYRKLGRHNAPVLATIDPEGGHTSHDTVLSEPASDALQPRVKYILQWHHLTNHDLPSSQVHFWAPGTSPVLADTKQVIPVLKQIGMKLASVPLRIRNHFNHVKFIIPKISPTSVYDYYTKFYEQVSPNGRFPCDLAASAFKSVANFRVFTSYLLKASEDEPKSYVFPEPPFDYPLLLTADGKIRLFDKENKVIHSHYWSLFAASLDKFLHQHLLDLCYERTYFLTAAGDNYQMIHGIFSKALPAALNTQRVHNANQHIQETVLMKVWKCLSNDPVFASCVPPLLQQWALLFTDTNQLFTCSSEHQLLPTLLPSQNGYSQPHMVFQRLGMPFLKSDIVCCPSLKLPSLSDHEWMLRNLFYLHQEADISSALSDENVKILVKYFRNVNFKVESDFQNFIKALPLFLSIEGKLISIAGKEAYTWPTNVCTFGLDKCLKGKNVMFLDTKGEWTNLTSAADLGIEEISPEDLYIRYIFPEFSRLNEQERFRQLKHIRDELYYSNRNWLNGSSHYYYEYIAQAQRFLDALKGLPSIGRDGETLKCVSEFCTHQEEIFQAFSSHFYFLPECFTSPEKGISEKECDKWMNFFLGIGLRNSITMQEFLQFCKETAAGRHHKPKQASSALLNYLFSSKALTDQWHGDPSFLSSVSQISFVCSEKLPELSWIVPVYQSENRIQMQDQVVDMTRLRGAVLYKRKVLLWTVKPIVSLPCDPLWHHWHSSVLDQLGVIQKPSVSDVIQNISNISRSRFANIKLFDNYPDQCKPPTVTATGLVEVSRCHCEFLKSLPVQQTNHTYGQLSSLQCIPVYAHPRVHQCPVLVQPSYVLTGSDVEDFFPFLNCLPTDLLPAIDFLEKLGVKSSLKLSHMKAGLQMAFQHSDELVLEPNTEKVVQKLIRRLYIILKEVRSRKKSSDAEVASALTPLYLPAMDKKLLPSTSLLYCDSVEYKHCDLDLSDTGFSLLSLPEKGYDFHEEEFCRLLPKAVRPKGLSQCCTQVIHPECTVVEDSEVAEKLQITFRLENLPRVFMRIVRHRTNDEQLCLKCEPFLTQFLQNVKVTTVENLRTNVILKINGDRIIGSAQVEFHLQEEGTSFSLYLDSSKSHMIEFIAFDQLADRLLSVMKPMSSTATYIALLNLKESLSRLLRAQSQEQLLSLLDREGIRMEGTDIKFEASCTPKLGKTIPQSWLHRLDQDINNIFQPEEWVGYEEGENHVIFAQVVHPVMTEGVEMGEVAATHLITKYRIYISEADEEGKVVSALDLYKFLRGQKPVHTGVGDEVERDLVPFEGESEPIRLRQALAIEQQDLKYIKKQLCQELRQIWSLPEEERKKAIRRLYLKWHPDKNPDQLELAEEIFKFLKNQIERLEEGLPLEDPEQEGVGISPRPRVSSSFWESYFRRWDETAHQHHNYWESEERYYRGGGGDGGGRYRRGGGGEGHHFSFDDFDFSGPQKQPGEAKRWVKQAEVDFKALTVLHNQLSTFPELSGHVCFMAHEVAEKALKGGMYAICGLGDNSLKTHNLISHAYALQAQRPAVTMNLAALTSSLEKYYLDTRFPNRHPGVSMIPADMYSPQQAEDAKEMAGGILGEIKKLMAKESI